MQRIINELISGWRAKRSLSQMTLGKLIKTLKKLPSETKIENICSPNSYRGYYSDLAFVRKNGNQTTGKLLSILQDECLNQTFEGYKGGDFKMDKYTPLWIAEYGQCGLKIMELKKDKVFYFTTQSDK